MTPQFDHTHDADKSLASKFPQIAAEWHPTKNGDLTPDQITPGSKKKVWWLGKCGHEWDATVASRTGSSRGCPFESGQRTLAGFNDLATKFPEIAAEWHPTKNGDITSAQITPGSNKKVWWLGTCGHEWDMLVRDRTGRNQGCPFEAGKRILVGFNDFATKFPEIAAEWHPIKNGDLTPDQVFASNNRKKVWWLGTCGHEWETTVKSRTAHRTGCPVESGMRTLDGFNDLLTKFPEIAAEWHPTKNGDLTPNQITAANGKKVWWLGACGHTWDATVSSRTVKKTACPFEVGQRVLSGFNDLATKFPDVAAEWHPTKNGELTPDQISAGSEKKVWWLGTCGHEWDAVVHSRTGQNLHCPFESGQRLLSGFNDLATKFPEIAAEWHPTKNGDLTPDQVSAGSHKKVWWLGNCGHEWDAKVGERTGQNHGCPFESRQRTLYNFNDLATKFPDVAAEWHPTKNGDLTPDQISAGSHKKVWWLGNCGHEWDAKVGERTRKQQGCPFEAKSHARLLTGFNDLLTKFPAIAAEWHPNKNGDLTPNDISAGSNKKVWWLGTCGHEWDSMVTNRTRQNQGCPFESGRRTLAGFNDLATKFPEIAAEWHPTKNGDLTPDTISASNGKKVWWLGSCGHEWETTVGSRTGNKTGCPFESRRRTLDGFNDLATKFPGIATGLHHTKNSAITPDQVTADHKKVQRIRKYWHALAARIAGSNEKNAELAFASSKRTTTGFNDLATKFPDVAAEWHPTKNGDLTSSQVTPGSNKKVWWLGTCGHEWDATVNGRTGQNLGCPFDSGHRTLTGFNDLATKFPEIAAEWHPTKNGDLTPNQVTAGSEKKVWWLGKCGHEWDTRIKRRTGQKSGCPFESRRRRTLTGFNDLATKFPEIAAELHPTKNGDLTPDQIFASSSKKVWWLGKCGHTWDSTVANRTVIKTGCPFDSSNRLLSGFNDLATKFPKIAAEWHPTKNGDLTPDHISSGSHKKVWWLGTCGHEWETTVDSRTKQKSGCPFESGLRTLAGFNDLATKFPKIAAEWHPTKNGGLTPDQISAGNSKKVWWLGICGHEWETTVSYRTRNNRGCPFESGRRTLAGFNDLATKFPKIAAEWHPTKNGDLTPDKVFASSGKKVWWLGKCGHEWDTTVKSRTGHRTGCQFESGQRTLAGFNDFATKFPKIAAEWHPTKNGDLTPDKVFASSDKKVWWLGACGHTWRARINGRTVNNQGCLLKCHTKSLATRFPEIAAEWHPTKNGDITPDQISAGSHKQFWWLGACGHEWETTVAYRTRRNFGCPFESNRRPLAGFNDLATQFPEIAAEWHPTKNGGLTSDKISAGSHKKVWWLGGCGHEWETTVAYRTRRNFGCPFESGQRLLSGFNDLVTKFPEIAAEWHPTKNGELTPDQVFASSNEKAWWFGTCGHEWDARIGGRTGQNRGCPFESGQSTLTGFNDLATKFPEISVEWHPTDNGDLTPDQVFALSGKKVWWLGKCGHAWTARVSDRTRNNQGCPFKYHARLLATKFPEIAAEWHPTKNGNMTPDQISAGSHKKVWWLGGCGHEWESTIDGRTRRELGCPFELGRRTLAGFNDLATKFPEIAAEWHPTKNGDFTPDQVTAGSNKKVWWLGTCGHEWDASVRARTRRNVGCPFESQRHALVG